MFDAGNFGLNCSLLNCRVLERKTGPPVTGVETMGKI